MFSSYNYSENYLCVRVHVPAVGRKEHSCVLKVFGLLVRVRVRLRVRRPRVSVKDFARQTKLTFVDFL